MLWDIKRLVQPSFYSKYLNSKKGAEHKVSKRLFVQGEQKDSQNTRFHEIKTNQKQKQTSNSNKRKLEVNPQLLTTQQNSKIFRSRN